VLILIVTFYLIGMKSTCRAIFFVISFHWLFKFIL
jgi:hypothetical protein